MKGLLVEVMRPASGYDCTMNGVSSKGTHLVLVKNGTEIGPFDPTDNSPPLYLARWCGRLIACPENLEESAPRRAPQPDVREVLSIMSDRTIEHLRGWMFGGNFVYSCDSRFAKLTPGSYPIPVYDRKEA